MRHALKTFGAAGLCLILLALCACSVSFGGSDDDSETSEEETTETISYNGDELPVDPSVSVNPYDNDKFVQDDAGLYHYEGKGYTSLTGIDVSKFQGDIDWQEVADAGVEFAMIRVGNRGYGSGEIVEDDLFEQNIQGALDAGIRVGVYFYSQAVSEDEVLEEAEFVLDQIKDWDITMPVAYDFEYIRTGTARTDSVSNEEMTQFAVTFCETVEKAGYQASVYFGIDQGYMEYDLGEIRDYEFWLARPDTVPGFYYDFQMWQYSYTGTIPGISTDVDLDVYITKK
ncbi:MAG: glycoside hydrolase family 25 protein [Oscillospiraceae bacterium]|nr:glycoside hydrolase family 25 protein [Oscillospiraceae bacterium]